MSRNLVIAAIFAVFVLLLFGWIVRSCSSDGSPVGSAVIQLDSAEGRQIVELIGRLAQTDPVGLDAFFEQHLDPNAGPLARRSLQELARRLAGAGRWSVGSLTRREKVILAELELETDGATAWASVVLHPDPQGFRLHTAQW